MREFYTVIRFVGCIFFLLPAQVSATHIVGGEISYVCIGNDDYEVTLKVYRDCFNGQAAYDNPTNIFIYDGTGVQYTYLPVPFPGSDTLPNTANNPCIIIPPNICVEEAIFEYTVNLPANTTGYKMIYQRCCRNYSIVNIFDPSNTGATYEAIIPPPSVVTCNSSPYFNNFPPTVICANYPFEFDHSATDPDGDSLVYYLCDPYNGATSFDPYPFPPISYSFINFLAPYSAADPMGGLPPMNVDSETGLLTVTPGTVGQFVVGVCVDEYRNGVLLETHKRDFQFNVAECTLPAIAALPALINGCDGFTFSFPNYSTGATTYLWDFGVIGITSDTSSLFSPSYTYSDTGIYTVTLYANPGSGCGDTATMQVFVYPTFTGVIVAPDGCVGLPIQFLDSTNTTYGYINYWSWNFANLGGSLQQNPIYTFDTAGTFLITLAVQNTMGCYDSVTTLIEIHPQPDAFAALDTTICYLDTIQLFGVGLGDYLWSPSYGLSSDTAQNPWASPDISTQYILQVENQWGCHDEDTIFIEVIDSVDAIVSSDTVICPGGLAQLNASGGWLYSWSPPGGLSNPFIANPIASPPSSTVYIVTTNIGSCFDSAEVIVEVLPPPEIFAGPDQKICHGDSVMIEACCGTFYSWTPANSLSDPFSDKPIAFPIITTHYALVSNDSNSCPLNVYDTVKVEVIYPNPLATTPDTLVYLGTSAQLYSWGAISYEWSPSDFLNEAFIPNPISTPVQTITYHIFATTTDGCKLSDSVTITVVEDPLVILPNAFTPNGDGVNDYFLPIILGLFEGENFVVFNRWGQMMHQTGDMTQGWDGKHEGREEEVGTYVYHLEGRSLSTGKRYFLKGNVVLLR